MKLKRKLRWHEYPIVAASALFAAGWYAGGAIKALFGIGRAVTRGEVGERKIYAESEREKGKG